MNEGSHPRQGMTKSEGKLDKTNSTSLELKLCTLGNVEADTDYSRVLITHCPNGVDVIDEAPKDWTAQMIEEYCAYELKQHNEWKSRS